LTGENIGGTNRVDDPAVSPDLALCPGEHLDLPHLDHGLGELALPFRLAAHEGVDQCLHGSVGQQRSIRLKEAEVVGQANVVLVVKLFRRDEIHERRRVREELAAVGWADALEEKCVGFAQRRVNLYTTAVDMGNVLGKN